MYLVKPNTARMRFVLILMAVAFAAALVFGFALQAALSQGQPAATGPVVKTRPISGATVPVWSKDHTIDFPTGTQAWSCAYAQGRLISVFHSPTNSKGDFSNGPAMVPSPTTPVVWVEHVGARCDTADQFPHNVDWVHHSG